METKTYHRPFRGSVEPHPLGGSQAGKAPDFGSGSEGSIPSRPTRGDRTTGHVKDEIKIFAGSSNRPLAGAICQAVGVPLGQAEIGRFSDGECQVEITENVRGSDVFVVQSTCTPTNDHIMELLLNVRRTRSSTLVLVTHDAELASLADSRLVLRDGRPVPQSDAPPRIVPVASGETAR